jgi:hypothetical protein
MFDVLDCYSLALAAIVGTLLVVILVLSRP